MYDPDDEELNSRQNARLNQLMPEFTRSVDTMEVVDRFASLLPQSARERIGNIHNHDSQTAANRFLAHRIRNRDNWYELLVRVLHDLGGYNGLAKKLSHDAQGPLVPKALLDQIMESDNIPQDDQLGPPESTPTMPISARNDDRPAYLHLPQVKEAELEQMEKLEKYRRQPQPKKVGTIPPDPRVAHPYTERGRSDLAMHRTDDGSEKKDQEKDAIIRKAGRKTNGRMNREMVTLAEGRVGKRNEGMDTKRRMNEVMDASGVGRDGMTRGDNNRECHPHPNWHHAQVPHDKIFHRHSSLENDVNYEGEAFECKQGTRGHGREVEYRENQCNHNVERRIEGDVPKPKVPIDGNQRGVVGVNLLSKHSVGMEAANVPVEGATGAAYVDPQENGLHFSNSTGEFYTYHSDKVLTDVTKPVSVVLPHQGAKVANGKIPDDRSDKRDYSGNGRKGEILANGSRYPIENKTADKELGMVNDASCSSGGARIYSQADPCQRVVLKELGLLNEDGERNVAKIEELEQATKHIGSGNEYGPLRSNDYDVEPQSRGQIPEGEKQTLEISECGTSEDLVFADNRKDAEVKPVNKKSPELGTPSEESSTTGNHEVVMERGKNASGVIHETNHEMMGNGGLSKVGEVGGTTSCNHTGMDGNVCGSSVPRDSNTCQDITGNGSSKAWASSQMGDDCTPSGKEATTSVTLPDPGRLGSVLKGSGQEEVPPVDTRPVEMQRITTASEMGNDPNGVELSDSLTNVDKGVSPAELHAITERLEGIGDCNGVDMSQASFTNLTKGVSPAEGHVSTQGIEDGRECDDKNFGCSEEIGGEVNIEEPSEEEKQAYEQPVSRPQAEISPDTSSVMEPGDATPESDVDTGETKLTKPEAGGSILGFGKWFSLLGQGLSMIAERHS